MTAAFVTFYLMYAQADDLTTLAEEALTQIWVEEDPTTLSTWVEQQPQGG